MSGKKLYWQKIRGICILGVVLIHCPSALDYGPVSEMAWIIFRQIIVFPVAVFLFLAGYFLDLSKYKNYRNLLKVRGGRLLIPYLMWSIVYLGLDIVRIIIHGDTVQWADILLRLLTGQAIVPFYYIVVLFIFTVISPILKKIIEKRQDRGWLDIIVLFITPVYSLIAYCLLIRKMDISSYYAMTPFAWIMFYYVGMRIRYDERAHGKIKRVTTYMVFILLFLSIIEAIIMNYAELNINMVIGQLKYSSLLYSLFLIRWFYNNCDKKQTDNLLQSKILVWFGDNSYAIYLSHSLVLMLVTRVTNTVTGLWLGKYVLSFLLTVIISTVMIIVVKRIAIGLKMGNVLKLIGF